MPFGQAASQDISGQFVTASQKALPQNTRLDSWKAIAAFFGKDERTVKRWEKERGLPVRRVPGSSRGTVFAYTEELESWLAGPQQATDPVSPDIAAQEKPVEDVSAVIPASPRVVAGSRQGWRRPLIWAVPFALAIIVLTYASLGHHEIRFNNALAAPHHPDSVAQDLYLKGRFYFEKRTAADLNTAVDAFTQAIVHDPAYAQAYVGLADSYSLQHEYGTLLQFEAEQRARAAAQKAVELDPNLAEAHTSLAFAEFWGFLDAADADREFRRAIELDPNLARAHHWYATFLIEVQRPQESLAEIERARQLDPSSKAILADKGVLLFDAGHRDEALTLLKQMEASDPSFRSSHQYLGQLYWEEGNYEAALKEFETEASLRNHDATVKLIRDEQAALRGGGVSALLDYRLNVAIHTYEHDNGSAYNVASAYSELHRRNDAMKFLQLARQQHDTGLASVELAAEFRWLHADPEFRELVIEIGLPPLAS